MVAISALNLALHGPTIPPYPIAGLQLLRDFLQQLLREDSQQSPSLTAVALVVEGSVGAALANPSSGATGFKTAYCRIAGNPLGTLTDCPMGGS